MTNIHLRNIQYINGKTKIKTLIEDSLSFLEFNEDDMDRRFLISLIKNLGEDGVLFLHIQQEQR